MNTYFESTVFAKKTQAVVLSMSLILVSFLPVLAFPKVAEANDAPAALSNILINGEPIDGHCIAGEITITGSGITGHQGGPWKLDVGWGDNATTTIDSAPDIDDAAGDNDGKLEGAHEPFTFTVTGQPSTDSSGLTLFLHHAASTGNDGFFTVISQCLAAPTEGVVIVEKHVVNDNEGTSDASDFNLHLGGNNFVGSTTGTDVILEAGSYTLTEDADAGYVATFGGHCAADGSITVVAGENYLCTITNDDVFVIPNTPPVITLNGSNPTDITVGNAYAEAGATADDLEDGLGLLVENITGFVNHLVIGVYEIFYNFSDSDGAAATQVVRTVNVNPGTTECSDGVDNDEDGGTDLSDPGCENFEDDSENQPPVITVLGDNPFEIVLNVNSYNEGGATADDPEDGQDIPLLPSDINADDVRFGIVGNYTIYYNFTDSDGAAADQKTRTVNVVPGDNECNDTVDNDGDGFVDFPDDLGCTSFDDATENQPPVITLTGSNPQTVTLNDAYAEEGATADDAEDGQDIPVSDINSTNVNTSVLGSYIVYYNFTDTDGAAAAEVTRDVLVKTACADGIDNSDEEDELADANDPGCWVNPNDSETYDQTDNNETTPADVCANVNGIQTSGPCADETCEAIEGNTWDIENQICVEPEDILGCTDPLATNYNAQANVSDNSCTYLPAPEPETSGGGGGGSRSGDFSRSGVVLGEVLGDSCGLYMDKYIRSGRNNDTEQVKKLQTFLNKWMNAGLPVTGFYGPMTLKSLNAFQEKYAAEVLTPWGLKGPTGIAYITTLRWINMLECPELSLALPPLVNWSKNPNAPR